MKLIDRLAERLHAHEQRIHQEARDASLMAEMVESPAGAVILAALRARQEELAAQYDASSDFETICRIQGQRTEARRLLLELEGAPLRAATLQKAVESWLRKVSRLARKAS